MTRMIRMNFINHEPPTELETEMLRFVNDKIADLVLYHIDVARDCDGENLEDVFPRRFYLNNKKKCELVIHELYDTLCSDVLYHELIPIHRYVLFQVLEAYNQFCEYASDAPEFARFELPEALKKRIYQEIINTPEYEALYGADDDDFEDLHGGVGDDEKPWGKRKDRLPAAIGLIRESIDYTVCVADISPRIICWLLRLRFWSGDA